MRPSISKDIKALILDVDGTLTDGGLIVLGDGEEGRIFDVKDGFGVTLALASGLRVGILTGKKSKVIEERAQTLKISFIYQGHFDKLKGLEELMSNEKLAPAEIAYMGDDVLDLPVISRVGLTACPADAHQEVRKRVDFISKCKAGHGAVRDFIDEILRSRNQYNGLFDRFSQIPR